jgi:hypothetical protein
MINNIVACRSVVYHAYVLTVKVTYPMSSQLHIYIYIYIYIYTKHRVRVDCLLALVAGSDFRSSKEILVKVFPKYMCFNFSIYQIIGS